MADKPNLVYILADDMGYGDVSCLNPQSKIRTQHLDRMAAQGMAFTDGHSSSAVCTPSRYSILTGRYNWRSTLKQGVLFGYNQPLIEDGRTTIASLCKGHGYRTACVGKWHLGLDWTITDDTKPGEPVVDYDQPLQRGPLAFGFDEFFGISASLDMPPYVYIDGDRVAQKPTSRTEGNKGFKMWRAGEMGPDFDFDQVLPTLTDRACEFISENADNPFCLYFPLPAPHTPILPLPEYQGKTGTNAYGDFCLQCDDVVGRIMQTLEDAGVADNTILIFTSDNGCSPMADFTHLASMGHHPSYHFRGHKADIYEGGHRVPLIMQWPDRMPAGQTCDDTVCLVDLLATFAEILGETLPDDAGEDSVSNLPLWLGETLGQPTREATVHHSINGSFSIRQGDWKLELCPGSGGWSYPKPGEEPVGTPPIQLYNLTHDIGERINVYDQHPDVVEQLKALLTRYVKDGRSTPGAPQQNNGPLHWPQLNWIAEQ